MINEFKDMIQMIVDFMHTHSDPYFNLPFLTLTVAVGVMSVVTDFFTRGDSDDE